MSAARSQRRAAPKSKGAAARTEKKAKDRKVDFRGAKLTLPAALPLAAAMRLRSIQRAGEDVDPVRLFDFLEDLLPGEEYVAATDKLAQLEADGEKPDELFGELVSAVIEAYEVTTGES